MKKKIDIRKLLWYFILAFPLVSYLFTAIIVSGDGVSVQSFGAFMLSNFELSTSNILIDLFNGILGYNGVLPLFDNTPGLFLYFTYFIGVELIHIIMDVLLLLPNILHNVFDKIGGTHEKDF